MAFQTAPYLMPKPDTTGSLEGNDQYIGYCADLAKQIAELVDFDYIIKPVKDGKYGGLDDNNTWDGMVGELVRKVSATMQCILCTIVWFYGSRLCSDK